MNFTAIYTTPGGIKKFRYSFSAPSIAAARRYRKYKFSAKRVRLELDYNVY